MPASKLTQNSLLLTVQAVNGLYSVFDIDTSVSLLAINRPVSITGDLTVSGNISGTSSTALKLATARTISLSGDLTYTSPAFDGTANVTGIASLANVNAAPGTYGSASNVPVLVVNAKGLVTGYTSTLIAIATSQVTSGTFADARLAQSSVTQYQSSLSIAETQIPVGSLLARLNQNQTITGTWTFANSIIGNISTATKLATARAISTTGDGAWTTSFDGSADATGAFTLATVNSAPVTASFSKVTTNVKGLVTATTPVVAADITSLINNVYVSKAGDTMTGALGVGNPIQYSSLIEVSGIGNSAQITAIRYSADSAGPSFALVKTRGTTVAATTAVVSGDTLGSLGWYAQDGTTLQQTAIVSSVVESAVSSGVVPTSIVFKTTTTNSAGVTEKMRITSAGNVGIGLPPAGLYGHGGTGQYLQISNAGTAQNSQAHLFLTSGITSLASSALGTVTWGLPNVSTTAQLAYMGATTGSDHTSANPTAFIVWGTRTSGATFATEKMRLDQNGNLGIGTSSPVAKLDVAGDFSTRGSVTTQSSVTLSTSSITTVQLASGGHIQGQYFIRATGANIDHKLIVLLEAHQYNTTCTVSILANFAYNGAQVLGNIRCLGDATGANRYLVIDTLTASALSITVGAVGGIPCLAPSLTPGGSTLVTATYTTAVDYLSNVGIGRTSAGDKLEVGGPIAIFTSGAGSVVAASKFSLDEAAGAARLLSFGANAATPGTFSFYQGSSDNSISRTAMSIDSSGNVGINTAAIVAAKLSITTNAATISVLDSTFTQGGWQGFSKGGALFGYMGNAAALTVGGTLNDLGIRFETGLSIAGPGGVEVAKFTRQGAVILNSAIGYSFQSGVSTPTTYALICTLPASTASTWDQATLLCNFNDNWSSGANRTARIMFANRGGFTARFLSHEGGAQTPASRIQAYAQSDGTTQIYAMTNTGYYATLSYQIATSIQVTLVANPAGITTTPPGTLVFDTYTAVPNLATDASSNFTVNGTATVVTPSTGAALVNPYASSSAYTGNIYFSNSATAASTAWRHIYCVSSNNTYACLSVFGNGNVQNANNSYGAISDIKLKQDIVDASSQWDDIKALRIRKYHFKTDPTGPLQLGLIAQEVELTSPGLVETTKDHDSEQETKGVKYSVLYMKAVKALQEAQARVETLESQMALVLAKLGISA